MIDKKEIPFYYFVLCHICRKRINRKDVYRQRVITDPLFKEVFRTNNCKRFISYTCSEPCDGILDLRQGDASN